MPTIIPNFATLLSVFPVTIPETVRRHNGIVCYAHPPAPVDEILVRTYNPEVLATTNRVREGLPLFTDERKPTTEKGFSLIRVCDTFTWTRDFTQDNERFQPHPLQARTVAEDLQRSWASDGLRATGQSGPGVMVIKEDEPSPAELEHVREHQTVYFRDLVNDGHTMYSRGQLRDISDLHRAAAKWLGAHNLPWIPKLEQVEIKKCIACGNDIRKEALRCEKCNVDLPDFYRKYEIPVDQMVDPVVWALLERMPKRRAA